MKLEVIARHQKILLETLGVPPPTVNFCVYIHIAVCVYSSSVRRASARPSKPWAGPTALRQGV